MTTQILSRPRLSRSSTTSSSTRRIGVDDPRRDHRADARAHPRRAGAPRARAREPRGRGQTSRSTLPASSSTTTTRARRGDVAQRLANDFIEEHIERARRRLAEEPRSSSRRSSSGWRRRSARSRRRSPQVKNDEPRQAAGGHRREPAPLERVLGDLRRRSASSPKPTATRPSTAARRTRRPAFGSLHRRREPGAPARAARARARRACARAASRTSTPT